MNKIIEKLGNILFRSENRSDNKVLMNIIILGMIGTLLLLFSNIFSNRDISSDKSIPQRIVENDKTDILSYADKLSKDLEDIISLINGVGNVKVKVYVSSGSIYEYEYNQNIINKITNETDKNGGERQIEEEDLEKDVVIIKDTQGNEKPVIIREKMPELIGILIVAQGAEVSKVKYSIVKAVSRFLNLPVYKISVLPYQRR